MKFTGICGSTAWVGYGSAPTNRQAVVGRVANPIWPFLKHWYIILLYIYIYIFVYIYIYLCIYIYICMYMYISRFHDIWLGFRYIWLPGAVGTKKENWDDPAAILLRCQGKDLAFSKACRRGSPEFLKGKLRQPPVKTTKLIGNERIAYLSRVGEPCQTIVPKQVLEDGAGSLVPEVCLDLASLQGFTTRSAVAGGAASSSTGRGTGKRPHLRQPTSQTECQICQSNGVSWLSGPVKFLLQWKSVFG